jgi:hypothetical protein
METSRLIPALVLLFSTGWAIPTCEAQELQDETFTLIGVVKDRDSHMVLAKTTIIATDTLEKGGSDHSVRTRTDQRGKYKMSLPYDHVYMVEYWSQGHVAKRVIVDLMKVKEKEREGGNTMSLEITLFPMLLNVDYSAYKIPVAICRFDKREKKFLWDNEYAHGRDIELAEVKKQQMAERRSMAAPR